VPQAAVGRPFYESDLRHEVRLRPVHLAHLISGDSAAPSSDIRVRKIGKWARLNLQRFQLAKKVATNVRIPFWGTRADRQRVYALPLTSYARSSIPTLC
jgi:hypothetical protein